MEHVLANRTTSQCLLYGTQCLNRSFYRKYSLNRIEIKRDKIRKLLCPSRHAISGIKHYMLGHAMVSQNLTE